MSYRKLFCLFYFPDLLDMWNKDNDFFLSNGYTLIHAHSFLNDEPPYIMVKYWGMGEVRNVFEEDGESVSYYLIRTEDAQSFIDQHNEYQKEYEGCYLEGVMTRNCGEHNMSAREYAEGCDWNRPPKTKRFFELPNSLKTNSYVN